MDDIVGLQGRDELLAMFIGEVNKGKRPFNHVCYR